MKTASSDYLQRILGEDVLLVAWNDRPETTLADVIDLFEKAAALAESEGR